MSEMPNEELGTSKVNTQITVSCWVVAAFIWYFYQLFPGIGRIALSLHSAEGNPGARLSPDLFEFAQLPVRLSITCLFCLGWHWAARS
jgi:hypothetical protein